MRLNAIQQLGYICDRARFEDTLAFWESSMGAGPFWLFTARPPTQTFRGVTTDAEVQAAMTFLGDMQIEILSPLDERPSAWTDPHPSTATASGMLHHVLVESRDYDATIGSLLSAGCREGWSAVLDDGRRVAYVDGHATFGMYVEVIEQSDAASAVRTRMREQVAQWDGSRPRRDYAELRGA